MITTLEREEYMSEAQLARFRQEIMKMRESIMRRDDGVDETDDTVNHPDPVDRASHEESMRAQALANARAKNQLAEINAALVRIDDGSYGYCEDTGEEIGLARLAAYPLARLSIEAQTRKEQRAKFHAN